MKRGKSAPFALPHISQHALSGSSLLHFAHHHVPSSCTLSTNGALYVSMSFVCSFCSSSSSSDVYPPFSSSSSSSSSSLISFALFRDLCADLDATEDSFFCVFVSSSSIAFQFVLFRDLCVVDVTVVDEDDVLAGEARLERVEDPFFVSFFFISAPGANDAYNTS